jgi:hypothetical protein
MNAFWFHYNRPASKQAGHPVMTLHHKGCCLQVRRIQCGVPVKSRERKSQPHVVMAGVGHVRIAGDTAIISERRAS